MKTGHFFGGGVAHLQHVEIPGLGIEPTLQQGQCWVLNPPSHQRILKTGTFFTYKMLQTDKGQKIKVI